MKKIKSLMRAIVYILLIGILCYCTNNSKDVSNLTSTQTKCNKEDAGEYEPTEKNETYYESQGYQVFSEFQIAVKCPATLKDISRQSSDNFDFNYAGSTNSTFYQIMIIKLPSGTKDMTKNEYKDFLRNMFGSQGGGRHVLWGEEELPAYLLNDYTQNGYKGRGIAVAYNGMIYTFNVMSSGNLDSEFNNFTNNVQFLGVENNKSTTPDSFNNPNHIKKSNFQIQLKEIKFSDDECSYYVPTNADYILANSIDQERINLMKNFYGNYISDDSKGWTLAKQNIEKDCSNRINNSYGCHFLLIAERYYQNENIISITYQYSFYIGGAHGQQGVITYTFNKNTGEKITISQLIKDYNRFFQMSEKYFRKAYNIPPTANLNDYQCFMFEDNQFKTSNKFEFTDKGIRFYYDDYEVACYAMGNPEFIIPYSDIKGIINDEYLPDFIAENSGFFQPSPINETANSTAWSTYTNRQKRFSIDYPREWEVNENVNQYAQVVILAPENGTHFRTNYNVIVSNRTETIDELFQMTQQQMRNGLAGYQLTEKEYVSINGIRGIKMIASYRLSGYAVKGIQYTLKKADNTVYTITFTIGESSYQKDKNLIDNIIQTFKSF